ERLEILHVAPDLVDDLVNVAQGDPHRPVHFACHRFPRAIGSPAMRHTDFKTWRIRSIAFRATVSTPLPPALLASTRPQVRASRAIISHLPSGSFSGRFVRMPAFPSLSTPAQASQFGLLTFSSATSSPPFPSKCARTRAMNLSHGKSKPGSVRRPGSSAWCDTNPTPDGLIADEYRLPGANSSRAGISNVAACW